MTRRRRRQLDDAARYVKWLAWAAWLGLVLGNVTDPATIIK